MPPNPSQQEDYFRELTQEDLLLLVPHCLDPSEDEALYVPFLGREPGQQQQAEEKPATGGRKTASKANLLLDVDDAEVRWR